jgi:EAL domain-containing protein (putative c-di-GMP-specific phosphodiesterase class I)
MSHDPGAAPGRWSGLIDELDDAERRALVDSALGARPRIEVDAALAKGWLEIWYQPKIDLKRKCLAGAEALARIRHPEQGVLLPGSFLSGVGGDSVARLTEHALVSTLRNWTIFDEAGFNLHLAINVPVSVLLTLPVAQLVEENKPACDRWPGLIVEVTEDQIVRDLHIAHEIADRLRVSGISIAIDDFGAGLSSLASLRELPFAELKLDHSFVRDCATDRTNEAICQTAIDLAHRFGSAAVAEGIERQADLQAIMAMGCDFGQGVLLAPPMPQQTFLELLMQRVHKAPPPGADDVAVAPAGRVA